MYKSFRTTPRILIHTLLSLMICFCLACSSHPEAGAPCPVIEMSAVADSQTDSTKTVAVNDTATILISRFPLVATADISTAAASQLGDRWVINVTVNDDAATRVREFTKQNVGRKLGTVVDGKVHDTPRIAAAIVGNSYQIGDFNQGDAERLAAKISEGCRR